MKLSQTQKDKAERAAFRGLDAAQSLVDMGLGDYELEKAFSAFRHVLSKIETAQIVDRRKKGGAA